MSELTAEEREALAEVVYNRKYAHRRMAMTPWSGLAPFQREQQRSKSLEDLVERILAARGEALAGKVRALAEHPDDVQEWENPDTGDVRQVEVVDVRRILALLDAAETTGETP